MSKKDNKITLDKFVYSQAVKHTRRLGTLQRTQSNHNDILADHEWFQ